MQTHEPPDQCLLVFFFVDLFLAVNSPLWTRENFIPANLFSREQKDISRMSFGRDIFLFLRMLVMT